MAVKIKMERPDQRRHHRITAPLFVGVDGHRIRATNWSIGGLRVDGYPGALPDVGKSLSLSLTIPFQGFNVSFEAGAEVVRIDAATRMFAVRFTELGERERELMSHFVEELVRGAMSDVEDTIQRIDVPVTPASLAPDPSPLRELPVRRWPARAVAMSGLYIALGIIIFCYTALLLYSNFFRLEVQTAVITAPTDTVVAQGDGRVKWLGVKPGQLVKSGQAILGIIDNQLERDIELAEIAVKEQQGQLLYYRQRQVDELERMRAFATMELKNVEQSKLELESTQAQLKAAEAQHRRLQQLAKQGFTTDAKLDEAEKLMVSLRKTYESRRLEMDSRLDIAQSNLGKRFYNGDNLVGDIADIEAKVRLAEVQVEAARRKHTVLVQHRDRLSVRAPFDGALLSLSRVDQGSVKRGDVVAVLEQRRKREVVAYLNQDEVLKVGIGDEALIYIPALEETLKARVRDIDRTSGFVEEQNLAHNPGYRWRGATDRTAKVFLDFTGTEKGLDLDRYRSGLPVVTIFPQRSTNSLLVSMKQRIMTITGGS